MRPTARRTETVSIFAAVGLVLGIAGFLGWRYAAPPEVTLDRPFPSSNTPYVMFYYDGFVSFPPAPFWPICVVMPVLGCLVGGVVGAALAHFGLTLVRDRRDGLPGLTAACAYVGSTVGLTAAVVARIHPPRWPAPVVSDTPIDAPTYPTRWDIGPTFLSFPLAGAVIGLGCAGLLGLLSVRLKSAHT